ncbi:MAG: hypothetical protein R3232_04805 [Clostridia bacterium]|nr:hypothetical protein [Clostridia bacterium]
MKTYVIKTIGLIISVILFISACNQNTRGTDDAGPGVSTVPGPTDMVHTKDIYDLLYTLYLPYNSLPPETVYIKTDKWSRFLRKEFDIKLKVKPIDAFLLVEPGKISFDGGGMIYAGNMLPVLIESGWLTDLNQYIDGTEIISKYTKEHLSAFSKDGSLYAIPAGINISISTRHYYDGYLSPEEIEDIDTVDELYRTAMGITYDDPDGNGLNDTPALRTSFHNSIMELSDIQRAFGCYFNESSGLPFGSSEGASMSYVPSTDSYEDCVFSDGIREYLYFIEDIYNKGILDMTETDYNINVIRETANNPPLAMLLTSKTRLLDNYVSGPDYLVGTNDRYLNMVKFNPECYSIIKETENIGSYVQMITEGFDKSIESVWAMKYGIPGEDYEAQDSIRLAWVSAGAHPWLLVPTERVYSLPDDGLAKHLESTVLRAMLEAQYARVREIYYETDFSRLFISSLDGDNFNPEFKKRMRDKTGINFNKLVLQPILLDGINIDEAIDNYKDEFRKSGWEGELRMLNFKLGKSLKYDYK